MVEPGEKTIVHCHEDKRHIYQEGDYVKLTEVEGMEEINEGGPYKICATTKHTVTIELDSRGFSPYTRQGLVENVKMPKEVSHHSWAESFVNPVASSQFGMLETPDLSKFGRSEQLHTALFGITEFLTKNGKLPAIGDQATCLALAKAKLEALKAEDKF